MVGEVLTGIDVANLTLTDFDVLDKSKVVFGDNYPRLQKIKKRYDPDNIFNKWFPITPA